LSELKNLLGIGQDASNAVSTPLGCIETINSSEPGGGGEACASLEVRQWTRMSALLCSFVARDGRDATLQWLEKDGGVVQIQMMSRRTARCFYLVMIAGGRLAINTAGADSFSTELAQLQARVAAQPTNATLLFQIGDLCYD